MEMDAYIGTRLDSTLKEKFEDVAKSEKRKPADLLRLMIEERVAAEWKPQRRQAAGAASNK